MRARLAGLVTLGVAWLAVAPVPARALSIVATFDTSLTNHPQAATIMATLNAAIAQFEARIADPITVNITFNRMYVGLGGSSTPRWILLYSNYLTALRTHAGSTDDAIALGHLAGGPANPVNGNDSIYVTTALARALGLGPGPQPGPNGAMPGIGVSVVERSPTDASALGYDRQSVRASLLAGARSEPASVLATRDGTISFNLAGMNLSTNPTPPGQYGLFAVASHEIDEVLGSSSSLNNLANGAPAPTGPICPEDLFRYKRNGNGSFTTTLSESSYFSLDGITRLARFNQTAGYDFSDWYGADIQFPDPQVQDAIMTLGADPVMGVEWRVLDALGWSYGPKGVWVDFNYAGGVQTGDYATPFPTLAQGVIAVPIGGTVLIKGNGVSLERPNILKAMTLTTVGGPATIGQ